MRDKILDVAQRLVQERGLNAVSFQDIAQEVGLKKPSLFHHFANKDAVAEALLLRCRTSYGERYAEVLNQDVPAPEKLKGIAHLFDEGLRKEQSCLLAALGNGSGTLSESLREELQRTADLSVERYTTVFQQGRSEGTLQFSGEPKQAAQAFLGMLQGLQILLRAEGKLDGLTPAANAFIKSISTSTTE